MPTRVGLSVSVLTGGRRGGGGYSFANAEAQALVARFTTQPTNDRKALIDAYYSAIKSGAMSGSNILAKLDLDYMLAAHDAQAARQNWAQDAFNLSVTGGPTFTADRGYTGDGASAYLATGYSPGISSGVAVQDSTAIGEWCRTDVASGGQVDFGGIQTRITPNTGGFLNTRVHQAGTGDVVATATSVGHTVASRTGAAVVGRYRDGVSLGDATTASAAPLNSPFLILAFNNHTTGGVSIAAATTRQVASVHAGSGLTAAEVTDLYNAKRTFLQAIGAA